MGDYFLDSLDRLSNEVRSVRAALNTLQGEDDVKAEAEEDGQASHD